MVNAFAIYHGLNGIPWADLAAADGQQLGQLVMEPGPLLATVQKQNSWLLETPRRE